MQAPARPSRPERQARRKESRCDLVVEELPCSAPILSYELAFQTGFAGKSHAITEKSLPSPSKDRTWIHRRTALLVAYSLPQLQ
jgi:hypothetical protein